MGISDICFLSSSLSLLSKVAMEILRLDPYLSWLSVRIVSVPTVLFSLNLHVSFLSQLKSDNRLHFGTDSNLRHLLTVQFWAVTEEN